MLGILVLLVACDRGPVVQSVDPVTVPAGEPVRVQGQRFPAGAQVMLQGEAGSLPLEDLSVTPEEIRGTVPVHVQPGTYDVVVGVEGQVHGLEKALVVERPPQDVPCTGEYTANTQLSLARELVVVDRFYRDGARERIEVPTSDIERIEYERRAMDGGFCSVIFLRRKDGSRLVFDDDVRVELEERAEKMARDLGLALDVAKHEIPAAATTAEGS